MKKNMSLTGRVLKTPTLLMTPILILYPILEFAAMQKAPVFCMGTEG